MLPRRDKRQCIDQRVTSGNDENTLYPPLPLAGEGRGEAEGGPLASGYHYAFPPHLCRKSRFGIPPSCGGGERNIVKAYFLGKARE